MSSELTTTSSKSARVSAPSALTLPAAGASGERDRGAPCSEANKARHRIEARAGWAALNLAELWEYRELLWFAAIRDIKVRYKQTVLGIAWAVIQPLMTMLVLAIFFG